MQKKPSERIKELGLVLPPAPPPAGLYKPVLVVDHFLYISGQGPMQNDGSLIIGRAGHDMTMEEAKVAARQVALTMLSTIQTHFGDIDKIKRIVKTLGMVNSTPDFGQQPLVINGFSELMADLFGPDNGVGVRSAVGMILPGGIPVEIEAHFQLHQ
ncbi:RidA family protein [Maribacter stanieri]|uniref:Enamine deaminase RidA, house cleaning of reactive enamine intermediates, YjgF/YER057c/UK114 family n=1 Tax=Maribacter stanieri TaxID=440514 RepID=A0A1I6HF71_9FLAO|nr:RidA family protein [Maribacter stanieri]SFR53089.1 Enamine deaminase RidA, house cleaning of reactive enamine intermediates, YjgF/YER057c/UK114 family [Maribacter stanieri]